MNKHLKTLTDTYTEDLVENRGVSAGVYIIIAAQHKIIIKEFTFKTQDEADNEIFNFNSLVAYYGHVPASIAIKNSAGETTINYLNC